MKQGVRPSMAEDAPAIAALLTEAGLKTNVGSRDLYWKYWQERSDSAGPRSYVVANGREILAHAGVVPGAYAWDSSSAQTLHMVDWAARSQAMGAGVLLMKHIQRLAESLLAIGGSDQTLQILPRLGFRSCGSCAGYVRTLRPFGIIRRSENPAWKLLPRLARSMYWTLTAPSGRAEGWELRRISAGELSDLAVVFPTPRRGLAVFERRVGLFRHILECPFLAAELYGLSQAGRLRGYFLLTYAPGQARLADGWIESDDPIEWRALISCAVCMAKRRPDIAEIVSWESDPLVSSCLVECGFHARHTLPIQILASDASRIPSRPLRVQMLDSDAAYLHKGRSEFWA